MFAVRGFVFSSVVLWAGMAHAQLPAGPQVMVGPAGINEANAIGCVPNNTGLPGFHPTCTFTIVAPSTPDLQCVRLVNFKTVSAVPLSGMMGLTCMPAAPSSVVRLTYDMPALRSGSIIGNFSGLRSSGQTTATSGFVQIPDASFPRAFQLVECVARAVAIALGDPSVPSPDPLCPVVGNDIGPFEFAEQ